MDSSHHPQVTLISRTAVEAHRHQMIRLFLLSEDKFHHPQMTLISRTAVEAHRHQMIRLFLLSEDRFLLSEDNFAIKG